MEKYFLIFITVLVLLVSGCADPGVFYSVWNGNNDFARGDYQSANIAYLRALQGGVYSDYISYNLATVYYALGEAPAAMAEWENSSRSLDDDVLFRTVYNRGVLNFELGRYTEAFEDFKNALIINPGDMDAKINLEYSLRRMSANNNPVESSASSATNSDSGETSDEIRRVLQFIKRKDSSTWQPVEEQEVEKGVRDW